MLRRRLSGILFPEQAARDANHGPIRFRWDKGESEKAAVFLIKRVRCAVKNPIS